MKYFEVTVQITSETEDSKGNVKVKKNNELFLVDAMSVTEAEARVVKLFAGYTQDFEVVSVRSSKVIEVVTADEERPKFSSAIKKQEVKEERDEV
jgi:hypothetical protein